MSYEYNYPMASHTADMIVFRFNNVGEQEVLLIERGGEPFKGCLALPGGFANPHEKLKRTAIREAYEEVHLFIDENDVEFVGYYDDPNRDPRGWTITTAFSTFVDEDAKIEAGDDAAAANWYNVKDVLENKTLAFDHKQILSDAYYWSR